MLDYCSSKDQRKRSTFWVRATSCVLVVALALSSSASLVARVTSPQEPVEMWDVAEISLTGPSDGNPFVEVELSATFQLDGEVHTVPGFYDGDGIYRVRYMPHVTGRWTFTTHSNNGQLDGKTGSFEVKPASENNHGPVRVHNTFHFAYADGTPHKSIGTTCYAWIHQSEDLQQQTLETLAESPFNKIRMCVFPKRYTWNENEPELYPYQGTPPDQWDFTRFNPKFFRHLEKRVGQLQELGIEADIILFHPYDRGDWGFDRMPDDADDRYLRYIVSRLAAYRNVWWSLANEYDFAEHKDERDWERFGQIVHKSDPYGRLLSIHNGKRIFNQTRPWITHASIQNGSAVEDPSRAVIYRDTYRKPVVFDEVKYEGDIPKRWGNISAKEMVHRFWVGTIAGTYVGHGETYLSPDDVLWWSKGGVLKGESPARLEFLRQVLADSPPGGINPVDKWQNDEYCGVAPDYYLVYLGKEAPSEWRFRLPNPPQREGGPPADNMQFTAEVLDTWNMTVTPVEEVFTLKKETNYFYCDVDDRHIDLPGRPYMAIRIKRVNDN